ncbi:hypothetical protein CALVIDRAFT_598481 [Calocera viscosa TUFC12733]|uniref:Uncharacterized protein n=1 Tax=Calocera viscosa (strain TUFC12733) TaxID=1330018 RepID=A0A167LY36_CALVF|nr:hypothetical protein CALVIDRAFT_598481 [Calocera viscosa TUFC12733]
MPAQASKSSSSTSTPSSSSPSPPTSSNARTTIEIPPWVDERCFTYCTQRSNARTFQVEPVCHTLCWRKVYDYEKRLINAWYGKQAKIVYSIPDAPMDDEGKRQLMARVEQQRTMIHERATLYYPAMMKRAEEASERQRVAINALLPELIANVALMKELTRKGGDREMLRQVIKEGKELSKRSRLIPPTYPRFKSLGDFMVPFLPPRTNNWSFLRGHYITYAHGTQKAGEHWSSMRNLFLTDGWEAAHALLRQGRDVGAVLDSDMLSLNGPPGTMGLHHLQGQAEREADKKADPNYVAIISLEHLPPAIYEYLTNRAQRIHLRVASLLERYRDSFASGHQWRTAEMLWRTVLDPEDGPLGMISKIWEAFERRRKDAEQAAREARGKEKGGGTTR